MGLGKTIREFGVKISLAFDKHKVEEAKSAIEEVGKSLKEIGLHVAEASAAMLEFANIAGEHSRALEENSAQLGINVEKLQELQYAAKVAANVSSEELNGALQGISKTLFEARNNNVEAAKTFVNLGITLDDVRNSSPDQILLKMSDIFARMPDGINKTALANQAFGSSGAKLIPLLNKTAVGIAGMGVEARRLGVILGKDSVEEGAEFDRQLSKIWIILKNITYLIGNEMIKHLGGLILQFKDFITQNRKFIATGITVVMKSLGLYIGIVFKTVKFLGERFKYLIGVLGGVEKVTKLVALSMGIFTGLKIVSGLGTLIKSFRAIAAVMGMIEAPALLIGAAFAALILIIQDLFSDDSIIKEWIKTFTDKFPNISKLIKGIFAEIQTIPARLGEAFDWVINKFDEVSATVEAFIDKFKAFSVIKDTIKDAFGAFATVGNWIGKGVSAITPSAQSIGKFGSSLSQNAEAYQQTRANPQAPVKNNNTNDNSRTQMVANINVQVPTGTTASAATQMVSQGVEQGFTAAAMRNTRDQALGGVAY